MYQTGFNAFVRNIGAVSEHYHGISRAVFLALALAAGTSTIAAQTKGHLYSLKFPDRNNHLLEVTATFSSRGQDELRLMMPRWSPGYYVVQDYAHKIVSSTATAEDGTELAVKRPRANRWVVECRGQDSILFRYQLKCDEHFVTTNWVGKDFAVLCGCATFIVPAEDLDQPCAVTVTLPKDWKDCVAGMSRKTLENQQFQFTAASFDTLVDNPIAAGNLREQEFQVGNCRHVWVDIGDFSNWEINQSVQDAEKIAIATKHFWGELPYERYYFLNVFRPGGGGLEHSTSSLLTATNREGQTSWRWHSFVSHEYFHTVNIKRLRPIELGPFDYEQPPRTKSLWISEGLTTYYGDLILVRSGLESREEFLRAMSSTIRQLQNNPGRLKQSLTDASWRVWEGGRSGVGNSDTLSYYVKGPVVGLLLDAKIRAATQNAQSLDDVMRAAYASYSRKQGFTEQQFRDLASKAAGIELKSWFDQVLDSPVELDYHEMQKWYGLEFQQTDDPQNAWKLQIAETATEVQKANLQALFASDSPK